jgi:tetratricopeptide (TPR) repeat protein
MRACIGRPENHWAKISKVCARASWYAGGLAWTGTWLGETLNLALDTEKPQAGRGFFSGGLELWTLRTFVVRGGYTSRGDVGNGLRLGAGMRFQTLEVDYAFANEGDLGTAHRIGVGFRFGKKTEEPLAIAESWYEKGVKEYRRARYTDALVNFNKALELDPNHPEALDMMKKTYEKIKATGTGESHE